MLKFNPDEARDESGEWTSGPSQGASREDLQQQLWDKGVKTIGKHGTGTVANADTITLIEALAGKHTTYPTDLKQPIPLPVRLPGVKDEILDQHRDENQDLILTFGQRNGPQFDAKLEDGSGWYPSDPYLIQILTTINEINPGAMWQPHTTPNTGYWAGDKTAPLGDPERMDVTFNAAPRRDENSPVKWKNDTAFAATGTKRGTNGRSKQVRLEINSRWDAWDYERIQKAIDESCFMPEATVENFGSYVAAHELGHVFDSTFNQDKSKNLLTLLKNLCGKKAADDITNDEMRAADIGMSKRCFAGIHEAMAEIHASYMLGSKTKLATRAAKKFGWERPS